MMRTKVKIIKFKYFIAFIRFNMASNYFDSNYRLYNFSRKCLISATLNMINIYFFVINFQMKSKILQQGVIFEKWLLIAKFHFNKKKVILIIFIVFICKSEKFWLKCWIKQINYNINMKTKLIFIVVVLLFVFQISNTQEITPEEVESSFETACFNITQYNTYCEICYTFQKNNQTEGKFLNCTLYRNNSHYYKGQLGIQNKTENQCRVKCCLNTSSQILYPKILQQILFNCQTMNDLNAGDYDLLFYLLMLILLAFSIHCPLSYYGPIAFKKQPVHRKFELACKRSLQKKQYEKGLLRVRL